mgnify:CR=1 FL=1
MNILIRTVSVLLLTIFLAVACVFMIGPQIMFIVPAAFVAGIVFAVRRSYWSLVCFGYPMTFAFTSALIGRAEIQGYGQTTAFAVSVLIGITGAGLIALGLWKVLPDRTAATQTGIV